MTQTLSPWRSALDAPLVRRIVCVIAYAGVAASLLPGGVTICFYLVAAYGFASWLAGAELDAELRHTGFILAGCYAALLLIDLVNGGSPAELLRPATNYFVLLALPSFAIGLRVLRLDIRILERVAIGVVIFAACWSLYQIRITTTSQAWGVKLGPAIFGMTVLTWSTFLFSRALAARPFDWRRGGAAAIGLIPILLAGSRIDWACSVLVIVVLVALWTRSGHRWRSVTIALLVLAVVAIVAYQSPWTHNRVALFVSDIQGFADSGDTTGVSFGLRYEMAVSGLRAFLDHPWLGYGLSHVKQAALAHREPDFSDFSFMPHLHNDYVTHLVAFGVLGVVFIFTVLGLIFWSAWRAADPGLRRFGVALTLALPVFMTVEIVFNQDPMYGLVFFVFGLLLLPPRLPAPFHLWGSRPAEARPAGAPPPPVPRHSAAIS